jgi:trigger factor
MKTQVKITEKPGWVRQLDIEVPAEDVDSMLAGTADKYRTNAEIPGFRKGKAPMEMVRARYGQAIRQDTLEELLPGAYEQAVKEHKLFPLGDPTISEVVFEPKKPFTCTVEITVRPDVEIKDYKGLKLKRQVFEVTDEDVNRQVERFREVKAELVNVTRPVQKGDVLICDLQKIHDSLNRIKESNFAGQFVDLTDERCAPEFLRDLPGMKIGEGKEIETIYPPDHPKEEFAGNTVLYRVWVKEIKQKNLPPVDDEFAKSLGAFKDLADLKEKVKADMERGIRREQMRDLQDQARKLVVEANQFEIPTMLIEGYLDSVTRRFKKIGEDLEEDKVRAEFRPVAEEQFRWDFIMHEVADREKIKVDETEVDAARKFIEHQQAQSDKGNKEKVDPDKLRTDMLEQKVFEYLIENAATEDVPRVLNPKIIKP